MQPSSSGSCAFTCCECGVAVGTEGPQRGTLLLPCQHVLHMGCVEFMKRRGKLLMGMDSADFVQDDGATNVATLSSSGHWTRQLHGCCVCPACSLPVSQIIPLYVRSEDDPTIDRSSKASPSKAKAADKDSPSRLSAASSPSHRSATGSSAEEFNHVHAMQKRVLLRLKGLCEQRRRMTELTHTCASLHEQRARHLSEIEKEERCFPGLLVHDGDNDGVTDAKAPDAALSTSRGRGGAPPLPGVQVDQMSVTELELYMAQITPRLLRTQADLRKERSLVERRTKKLTALRAHYHSTKELHALDAEIALRQAGSRHAVQRDERVKQTTGAAPPVRRSSLLSSSSVKETALLGDSALLGDEEVRATPPDVPTRKRLRGGEAAIDVDDVPRAEVVEVSSHEPSDAEEPEVVVLDSDEDDAVDGERTRQDDASDVESGVEVVSTAQGSGEDEANTYEAPYLIPCYVRTSAGAPNGPKAPTVAVTQNQLRMLPRREDRLWQPSLQF